MNERIYQYQPLWGAWEVDSLIGAGSFGRVYKIRRTEYGENFYAAVKIITIPTSDAELKQAYYEGLEGNSVHNYFQNFVTEILKEIKFMASLKGITNIVSIEDHKVVERTDRIGWDILIRMELLQSFADYISEHSLSRQTIIKLGIDICKALELCSKEKIVHRDVKPENIFVSPYGDFKLGDFGIARKMEHASVGTKRGTFVYMAPEIYTGEIYGATVDIYSLGLVLYRLVNDNRIPFLPASPALITPQVREKAIMQRILGNEFPKPRKADRELARVIQKACAYKPAERYQSPEEMREALECLQNPELNGAILLPAIQGSAYGYKPPSSNVEISDRQPKEAPFQDGATDFLGDREDLTMPPEEKAYSEDKILEPSEQDRGQSIRAAPLGLPANRSGLKKKLIAVCVIALLLLSAVIIFASLTDYSNGGAPVTGVEMETRELTLEIQQTVTLPYLITPTEATNKKVSWSSDKPEVAVVNQNGVVTAVSAGIATITVTSEDGRKSASCVITVGGIQLIEVALNKEATTLLVGGREQLVPVFVPADAFTHTVAWTSSDVSVVTVDASGEITAVGPGTATITVTAEDGGRTASCTVTVNETSVDVIDLTLNKSTLSLAVGESDNLLVQIAPANASNQNVNWSSSNSSVATVSETGVVTAKAAGTAVITVTSEDGDKSAVCTVTVIKSPVATQPVTGVTLNKSIITINRGATEKLTATILPANASNKNVNWKSSNTSVATVSNSGLVTAIAGGTATITVTTVDGAKTATCKVTVPKPPPPVTTSCIVMTAGYADYGNYRIGISIYAGFVDGELFVERWNIHFIRVSDSKLSNKSFYTVEMPSFVKHSEFVNAVEAVLIGTIDGAGSYIVKMTVKANDEFSFVLGDMTTNTTIYSSLVDFPFDADTFLSRLTEGSIVVECK